MASIFLAIPHESLFGQVGEYSVVFPGGASLQAQTAGNPAFSNLQQFRLEARYEAIAASTNGLAYMWAVGNFVSTIFGGPNSKYINFQDYSAGAPATCIASTGANTLLTVRMQKNIAGQITMQVWDATGFQIPVTCGAAPARKAADDLSGATSAIGTSGDNIGGAYSDDYSGQTAFFRLFSTVSASLDSPTETSGPGDLLDLEFEQNLTESHGIQILPLPRNASLTYSASLAAAPTPAFSPGAGAYATPQTVKISVNAPNLRYTTDNSDPTDSSTAVTVSVSGGSATVSVTPTQTITAYAFGPQSAPGAITAATYTLTTTTSSEPPVPTPAFNPAPGIFTSAQNVTITATGAVVKYTTDGSNPTNSPTAKSALSNVVIAVSSTETINAYAYKMYGSSAIVSAVYTMVAPSTSSENPANPISAIVGPVTSFGTSPWPWYDLAAEGNANDVPAAALAYLPQVDAQAAGTFTLADGCNITLSGPGAVEFNPGDMAVVAWNTVDGPGTGRLTFLVQSRNGNTLTSANQCGLLNIPPASGLNVYHCDASCMNQTPEYSCGLWGVCNLNGDSWNFYDPALALYRMYLRTNNVQYLNSFRQFTDTWWTWAIDHGGKVINPPRGFSLVSQYVRALDGHPERLPALYAQLKLNFDSQLLTEIDGQDNREPGYMLLFAAVGARADNNPARHAWYCSAVESHVQLWLNAQLPEGYWEEKNNFYAYAMPGVSPWRMFSILQGLARSYDVLADTSAAGCNDPALAAQDLTAIQSAVNFAYQYGYDPPNRGTFYDVQHPNDGEDGTNNGTMAGSVSVNLGATAVTGAGTSFLKTFACNGTDYIGIMDPGGLTWTHLVTSCSDNTHLTIATTWGSQCTVTDSVTKGVGTSCATLSVNGAQYYETPPAFTACRNLATFCWPNIGDRNSNRDLIWIHGWLYNVTGNPIYQTRGDELFSASYGGPAAGPGFNFPNNPGPCGGPGCDGVETDFIAAIHGCASNPTVPCNDQTNYQGIANAFVFTGKRWGQGSGIGGADNYLAWRTMAPRNATKSGEVSSLQSNSDRPDPIRH